MIKFDLPIYYTIERKTKNPSTILAGDNWFRNAHYHLKNQVKAHYHSLIEEQVQNLPSTPYQQFFVTMVLYYRNPSTDPSNVFHLMEKFALDGLQAIKVLENDNIKYHLGTSCQIGGQDKTNPRCEITITEIK